MTDIPSNLIENIKSKNIVLFLGAGFSFNAVHEEGKKPPLGDELANLISRKFLGGRYDNHPLTFVADIAISETNLFTVQSFIADTFIGFKPNENHIQYASFPWKAVFTTNYDLLFEESFKRNDKRVQELSPVFRDTSEQQIFKSPNSLPYYKLHGCISYINDIGLPLILSAEQYLTHKLNRSRLFSKLLELAMDYPILFVGYNNQDPNVRSILKEIESLKEGRPRSFMIRPGFKDEEVRFWESKKITALSLGHEDFIKVLSQKISEPERKLSMYRVELERHIYKKFQVSVNDLKPTESLIRFLDQDSEFVHLSIPSKDTTPQAFYKGFFQNWDPIIKNLDIERNEKDKFLTQIILEDKFQGETKPFFFLLKGYAGSGKSVLLKRMAWEASTEFDKLCIFINPNVSLRYEPVFELFNFVKERIYIFIDNAVDNEKGISSLLTKADKEKIPITIIASERTNVWNEGTELRNLVTEEFSLSYLSEIEIDRLVDKLEKHNSLGFLKNKTKEERVREFAEKAGRVLLVALYEATGGKPFEEIILDEFNQIKSAQARSLYLTVAILHRLGSEARAGLISRVHGISFHEFKEKLYKPLEFIVFDEKNYLINDYVYKTRHQHIAEMLFETVLKTEQDRYDEYVRILSYLDIDYKSDQNAFLAMTNARKLNDLFKDPIRVRNLYNLAEERIALDPKLLQQKAIFEMNSNGGSIVKAEQYLKQAHEMVPKDVLISHSLAEVSIKRAQESRNKIEKNQYLLNAKNLCEGLIRRNKDHPHSYHTLLKISLIRLMDSLDEEDNASIENKIKETEKVLSTAKQQFPEEEFILEIESRFNSIIDNQPKALALLEKAFLINKATPYIALRYAGILEKTSINEAIAVLKQTLDLNPNDKDVNYKYASLLSQSENSKDSDILHYYRRSFTLGDTRYQAQFYYARELYLANQIEKAKEIFDSLSFAKVSPEKKIRAEGIVKIKDQNTFFKGSLLKKEAQFAFVRRDSIGDDIFLHKNSVLDSWENYSSGVRVVFNLAFSYKGPVALSAKVDKD